MTAFSHPDLPPGDYGLFEMYCDEPGCDCRRVFFYVVEERSGDLKAVIAYGWESREFYVRWFGEDRPKIIRSLQGPSLNIGSPQSILAPALLEMMPTILSDTAYVERIKRHYAMYRVVVEQGGVQTRSRPLPRLTEKRPKRPKPTKVKKSRRQKKKK